MRNIHRSRREETSRPMSDDSSARHDFPALRLPYLILSLPLIALTAAIFYRLARLAGNALLYARLGSEGVLEFYQDLRFDVPLQTQLGAAFISVVYVGVGLGTICAAALAAPRHWPRLLAIRPIGGSRLLMVALFTATLLYAVSATLALTSSQDHRITISGPTDFILLSTVTANLVLLAPIAEEIFFRGWLYTGLRQKFSFGPSYLVTAGLFAAIHWDPNHRRILLVLPLALALGLLREVTGSIKPTIALHATYNLIIVVITLLET